MGNSSAREVEERPKKCYYGPLPIDQVPYPGPSAEYHIVIANVTFSSHFVTGFTPGKQVVSTDVNSYYPALSHVYSQGFNLLTFYRIPNTGHHQIFSLSVTVPFQGIFCRYPSVAQEQKWQLHIEKSSMYVQNIAPLYIGFPGHAATQGNTSHITQMISNMTEAGGRLICIEMTGEMVTQGMAVGMSGAGPVQGVDLFFNMPLFPNPPHYAYQAVSVPITITAAGIGHIKAHCDWMGIFASYLNQGWRLVEIFLDQSYRNFYRGGFYGSVDMNAIWFFEKELSAIENYTPLYEGTVVDFNLTLKNSFGGVVAKTEWESLLSEMGGRGWELACILETPEKRMTGLMSISMKLLFFFQRRLSTGLMLPPQPGFKFDDAPPSYEEAAKLQMSMHELGQ